MSVIDEYLNDVPTSTLLVLSHIRALVHATVPNIEEVMSYGMPSFRMNDFNKVVLGFAINKRSLAIYPHSGTALDKMHSDISQWRSSPSALNFKIDNPIPDDVIIELLHIRTDEIESGYGKK